MLGVCLEFARMVVVVVVVVAQHGDCLPMLARVPQA